MKNIKQKLFLIVLSISILNPTFVIAADVQAVQPTLNVAEYKGVDQSITDYLCTPSDPADGQDLERCINKLYRFGISFGAIAVVFFFVFAGYVYMTGGESAKGKAKVIVQNALVGMALLLGSYVLLYFINPNLVIYKPIQPPIFTAEDIPTCEDVGLGEKCMSSGGEVTVGSTPGGATGPSAKNCPSGLVAIGSAIPTSGSASSSSQICKDLRDALAAVVNSSKNSSSPWASKWRISSAPFGGGHKSKCHSAGNPQTGTCVDVSFGPIEGSPTYQAGKDSNGGNPVPLTGSRAERYYFLCGEIAKVPKIIIHNEAAASGGSCGSFNGHNWATNWHLHLILSQ